MIGTLKIGEILTRVKNTIDILDEELYTRITIKTKHAGVYKRDKLKGKLIGTKKQFKVKKGQFILSKIDARLGAFGIIPETLDDAIITGNFWVYEVDANKVNIDWFNLYTSSTSFYEVCNQASSGTTHRKYLDEKKFLNFSISLPTRKEQDSTYKWYINKLEKFSTLKNEIKSQELYVSKLRQAVLQDAIQGKLTFQDPTDELGSVLLERIKVEKQRLIDDGQLKKEKMLAPIEENEASIELPKGWVIIPLSMLIDNMDSGWSPLCANKPAESNEWGVLKTTSVQEMRYDGEQNKALPLNLTPKTQYEVSVDDILITRAGPSNRVGICCVVKETRSKLMISDKIIRLKPINKLVFSEYLSLCLNVGITKEYLESKKSGMALSQVNISQNSLKAAPIILPPIQEQHRIVTKVNQFMRLCDEMEQQITHSKIESEQLLQAVLREALEGEHTIPKQATKQDEIFWQKQLLASYINTLMEQHQEQGEMAIAKYAYLNDKIYNASSGFRYVQHNFGPYSQEIKDCLTAPEALFYKKTVGKKGYEVYHVNRELEVGFIDAENPLLKAAQNGFRQLMQVFSVFPMQERARELELIASICWLIEQLQSTDPDKIYEGFENWLTPKRNVQHKGKLFSKEEVVAGIKFIKEQGWYSKLLHKD